MKMEEKFWKIWDLGNEDPQYRLMMLQLKAMDPAYESALAALSNEQRNTVCAYLALCEAMSGRMLEVACEKMEFPE